MENKQKQMNLTTFQMNNIITEEGKGGRETINTSPEMDFLHDVPEDRALLSCKD